MADGNEAEELIEPVEDREVVSIATEAAIRLAVRDLIAREGARPDWAIAEHLRAVFPDLRLQVVTWFPHDPALKYTVWLTQSEGDDVEKYGQPITDAIPTIDPEGGRPDAIREPADVDWLRKWRPDFS